MKLRTILRSIIDRAPHVKKLKEKVANFEKALFVPPGHFYSPIVDLEEINQNESQIFNPEKELNGINLNEAAQWKLLSQFPQYYKVLPFTNERNSNLRYYYNNTFYSYSDAIFLFCMLLHFRPKRIIEIGSGFSSALLLDTNELHFDDSILITFIEPYPDNLQSLVKPTDKFTLIEKKIQEVDLSIFETLEENDILFIDSTHVGKTNSDVLFELFEILPRLKKGVKIHVHDIFYPFEYPKDWILNHNRSWNEIYLLRAFLMYNNHFNILAFNTFLEYQKSEWFGEHMPLCLNNPGGSFWMEKSI